MIINFTPTTFKSRRTAVFGIPYIRTYTVGAGVVVTYIKNAPLALDSIGGKVLFLGNGLVPYWNTAGRPTSPKTAQAGFNTDTSSLEIYNGTAWKTITLT